MITNASELNVALQQLGQFADTLEAMRLHAEKTNSRVFPVLSQVYIHRIREINTEIRAYLQTQPHESAEDLQTASAHP
jgi:hypothetical protein